MSVSKLIDVTSKRTSTHRLNFFHPKDTLVSHERYIWKPHNPLNPVGSPPWLYKLNASSSYPDTRNMVMIIWMRVSKRLQGTADFVPITGTDTISLIQMPGNCAFTMIITSQGREIYNGANLQAYKTYFDYVLSYPNEAKDTHLGLMGWKRDGPKQNNQNSTLHEGFTDRRDLITDGKIAEFVCKLDADILNIQDYFINNTELDINISPHSTNFMILAPTITNTEIKLEYLKATLMVPYHDLQPSLNLSINNKLNNGGIVYYSIRKSDIKTIPWAAGLDEFQSTIFLNQIPRKVIVAMAKATDMNGDIETSPYNFGHFHTQRMRVEVNGQQFPNVEYDLDFNNNRFSRAYFDMMQNCGFAFTPATNGITMDMYKNGFAFFVFNLSTSIDDHPSFELIRFGTTTLNIKLRQPLAEPVNVIVYGIFDSLVQIDKNRSITTDLTA